MSMVLFATPSLLIQGAFIGFIFGFLLQKGTVSRFNTIVGQFLLKDFTVLKIMLSAIIIGGIGMYSLRDTNTIFKMPIDSYSLMGSIIGGIIFGCGMTLFGHCPGTSIAAWAEGAHDAFFGIIGIFVGSALFELCYPWINAHILLKFQSDETLSSVLQVSPWIILIALTIFSIFFFAFLEKNEL